MNSQTCFSTNGPLRIALYLGASTLLLPVQSPGQAAVPGISDHWASLGDGIRGADGEVIDITSDNEGNVYVAGNFAVIGDVVANGIAKWDGESWSPLGSGMNDQVVALALMGDQLYAGGRFTTAGGVEARRIARWDGTSWAALGEGIDRPETSELVEVSKLAVRGTELLVGGGFSRAGGLEVRNIAKWDGQSWSALGTGLNDWVSALEVDGNDLYVGGLFTEAGGRQARQVAKWDGNAWSSLGFDGVFGSPDPQVRSLRFFDGDLYAAGVFVNAGDDSGDYIARWNGQSWSAVGSGLMEARTAIIGAREMTVLNGELYVGGNFTHAGGQPVHHVAKWDGTAWSPLGTGTGEAGFQGVAVRTLHTVNDTLLVGGDFIEAGEITANHLAQWDGTSWSTIGAGSYPGAMNRNRLDVRCIAGSGNHVYVAGNFTMLGDLEANGIVKWDGRTWSTVGSGLQGSGEIFATSLAYPAQNILAVGDHLYVSGNFQSAGGVEANRIAMWDGTSWLAMGEGLPSTAYVLKDSGGDLYAGGSFGVTKWDGEAWSSLPDPALGTVRSFALSGSELYAGGIQGVARWDGKQWSPLGAGPSHPSLTLAISGTRVFAAGGGRIGEGATPTVSMWDGATWTILAAADDPANPSSAPIGHFPTIVDTDPQPVVLSFIPSNTQDRMDTVLSSWDGASWHKRAIDTGRATRNWWQFPPVALGRDSLLFANQRPHAGARHDCMAGECVASSGPSFTPVSGKAAALLSRYLLEQPPFLEVHDGQAHLHFREPHVIPGRLHEIQRSLDLENWVTIDRCYVGSTGGIDFTDPDAPEGSAFYRAVPVE